jgi:shikimate kinase
VSRLLLVGMMGAGKSTVASVLAARLGWPQVDTDTLIERRAGATVADIFADQGEAVFRAAESQAITDLEETEEPLVVSVGGGAVLTESNRRALRAAGTVVWLRARPATLAARVGAAETRPLLARSSVGPDAALEQLAREREGCYQDASDLVVDVDDVSASEAADLVMAALARALRL